MKSRPEGKPARSSPAFSLQFCSGDEMGKELPVQAGDQLILGRDRTVQIVINDEKASRRHARIFFQEGTPFLEDLRSANGTFLNGRKIQSAALHDGDEIRVGQRCFKWMAALGISAAAHSWWDQAQFSLDRASAARGKGTSGERWLSGRLESVPLVDLVQLLGNAQQSGVLSVRCGPDDGRLHLRDGRVFHAAINGRTACQPEKTVYRLLAWKKGRFVFGRPEPCEGIAEITLPTSALLLEGAQLADELAGLGHLPPLRTRLVLANPLPVPLRELRPAELDLVQFVLEHQTVHGVLDHYAGSDLDAFRGLRELHERKLILSPD